MIKRLPVISILLLFFGLFFNFHKSHDHYPKGCDEFGYLQLSTELAGNFEREAFIEPLVRDLSNNGFQFAEYAWLILPHAYHLDPDLSKPVNQYQPGTSILLSIVPKGLKQLLFPLLVFGWGFLIIVILSFRLGWDSKSLIQFIIVFFIVANFAPPFSSELGRVNSLAFTFIPLILSGYFLFSNPKVAIVLLLLCVNFRIANLILIPVLMIVYLKYEKGQGLGKIIVYGLIALLPILIYNLIIFENPFALSYSSNDTAWASGSDILENLTFYFSWEQSWFRFHVFAFSGILLMFFMKRISGFQLFLILGLVLFNYSFFIVHKVQMGYYPYASLMIMFGILFSKLKSVGKRRTSNWVSFGFSVIVFIVMLIRFHNYENEEWRDIEVLKDYDVVWGDLYSSSSEYINGNRGMRYFAGTSRARLFVIEWLKARGVQQVFITNDLNLPLGVFQTELKSKGLDWNEVSKKGWSLIEI